MASITRIPTPAVYRFRRVWSIRFAFIAYSIRRFIRINRKRIMIDAIGILGVGILEAAIIGCLFDLATR